MTWPRAATAPTRQDRRVGREDDPGHPLRLVTAQRPPDVEQDGDLRRRRLLPARTPAAIITAACRLPGGPRWRPVAVSCTAHGSVHVPPFRLIIPRAAHLPQPPAGPAPARFSRLEQRDELLGRSRAGGRGRASRRPPRTARPRAGPGSAGETLVQTPRRPPPAAPSLCRALRQSGAASDSRCPGDCSTIVCYQAWTLIFALALTPTLHPRSRRRAAPQRGASTTHGRAALM